MYSKLLTIFLAIGLLVCSGSIAFANHGKVVGAVTDRQNNEPLPGANVYIEGTNYGAATDLNGRFAITNIPVGEYQLITTYMGYQKKIVTVSVKIDETVEVAIVLDFQSVQGEVVEVTAQAEGQMAAINQQLSSNTISNIVSQARIRELPDVNAAESIGRLPGISIQRTGGEATKVAIRGLAPKYNTVSVNGVRVPSTDGDNRSVDLSLISSSIIDGIEVKKALTADMDADALGGSIDLRLKEAPEQFEINVTAQSGYGQLHDDYGNYNFAASASNRFLDSRLGIIATFNTDEFDRSADKLEANYGDYLVPITNEKTTRLTQVRLREEKRVRGRTGGSLLLDYKLPYGKATLNTFYNQLDSDELFRINDFNRSNSRVYYDMERRTGETSIFTGGFGLEQNFDWLSYDFGISRTASRSKRPEDFRWRFGQEVNPFSANTDHTTHPTELPGLATIVDSVRTELTYVWVNSVEREEDVSALQLNVKKPFRLNNWISGYIKTGGKLRWLDRLNDEEQNGRDGLQYEGTSQTSTYIQMAPFLPGWNLENLIDDYSGLPYLTVGEAFGRNDFLNNDYTLSFLYNERAMMEFTRALQTTRDSLGLEISEYRPSAIGSRGRDYDGTERYKAGYIMGEINLGQKITFIPGIRWEDDYSRYNGQRYREVAPAFRNATEPTELDSLQNIRENSFWLPMIHLQIQPNDWLKIRLARTETLTRPDYIQYTPISTIDQFRSQIRAANGLLRPAQSTNFDAAISVFENKIGLFTVAGFHKKIEDLILETRFNVSPSVLDTYLNEALPPGINVPTTWYRDASPEVITYINNPYKATYKGFELDWQTNFWYLPSVLSGLVLSANYTYIESETKYSVWTQTVTDSIKVLRPRQYWSTLKTDSVRVGRMPDQPTHIANITLGYDLKDFSARLSFLFQSDVSTFIHNNNPLLDTYTGDYYRWDLTLKQKLGKSFEFFANFNNLNNRPDESFRGGSNITSKPSFTEYYGLTIDGGIRYKL